MSDMQLLDYSQDDCYLIKMTGEVRANTCPQVDRLLERICATPHLKNFIVDVTAATLLDSTALGTLARGAMVWRGIHSKPPTLISTHPDVTQLCLVMGLDQVFELVEAPVTRFLDPKGLRPVCVGGSTVLDPHLILEAHRTLISICPKNAEIFRDLIKILESESSNSSSAPEILFSQKSPNKPH